MKLFAFSDWNFNSNNNNNRKSRKLWNAQFCRMISQWNIWQQQYMSITDNIEVGPKKEAVQLQISCSVYVCQKPKNVESWLSVDKKLFNINERLTFLGHLEYILPILMRIYKLLIVMIMLVTFVHVRKTDISEKSFSTSAATAQFWREVWICWQKTKHYSRWNCFSAYQNARFA